MDKPTLHALLAGLGIDRESLGALALLPLIQVAWADGRIQERERLLILDRARELGLASGENERLLSGWLRFRPSERYLARGRLVLAELGAHPGETSIPSTQEIVALCEEVARAAGGLFDRVGSVSAEERQAISEIAEILAHPPAQVPSSLLDGPPAAFDPELDDDRTDPGLPALMPDPPPLVRSEEGEESPSDEGQGFLLLESDPSTPRVIPIHHLPFALGRRPDNDLPLRDDGEVSRLHCRIHHRSGRWYLVDCGSTNGTFVAGERILERRLRGGEELLLGGTRMRFHCGVSASPA